MYTKKRLALGICMILALTAGHAAAQVEYVIEISVDGLGGTYLNQIFNDTATGGTYLVPNFERLRDEGAGTLAAHIDNNNWETLPNHVSLITARPRDGAIGHNWGGNGNPAVGQTIHTNKGTYVAGVFDVAHDNGLTTGMYVNKTKFMLFDTYPPAGYNGGGSYGPYGAPDNNPVGGNNGTDKVDNTYINTSLGGTIADTYIAKQKTDPMQFAFLHFNNPDSAGHGSGWGSAGYNASVVAVDGMLGKIFDMIEEAGSPMKDKTAIVLTADHGTQSGYTTPDQRYTVPLYVWGPGVTAGADLYDLNPLNRQEAGSYPMTTYAGVQPIRNAEASNLALALLGLDAIPGSAFGSAQDLVVPEPASMSLLAIGALALIRRRRKA